MKRFFGVLFLMMIIMTSSALWAQEIQSEEIQYTERSNWFDFRVTQHFGLDRWSNANYVNDGLPRNTLTEFRGVFNFYFSSPKGASQYWESTKSSPNIGAFVDMGIGIMPAPAMRSLTLDRMPMPYPGTQYYLREILSESGNSGVGVNFKMTAGLFGKIPLNERLRILPCFGIGFQVMPQRKYEVLLKEDGSNNQYKATYIWNGDENEQQPSLVYLTGRLNFQYRLSQKSSLQFGLEYTWFLNSLDFYGKFTNTFNENIQRDYSVKGNKIGMFGISVGISFM